MPVALPVTIRFAGAPDSRAARSSLHPNGGMTRDLSEGGICFFADGVAPPPGLLSLEVDLPYPSRTILTWLTIAWQRNEGNGVRVGARFLGMGVEDRAALAQFLSSAPGGDRPGSEASTGAEASRGGLVHRAWRWLSDAPSSSERS